MTIQVEPIEELDLRLGHGAWDFAETERARIGVHWRKCAAANPRLWNGEVLICTGARVLSGMLMARFAATDYASYVAWRDWGRPGQGVCNCFGSPAIVTADGALVFGVMGGHTLNAGLVYPPGGSLEPRDVRAGGMVDVIGSIAKEIHEETGLDAALAIPGRMLAIFDGRKLAVVQELRFPQSFAEIDGIFSLHRDKQDNPELDALAAIRSTSQIDSRMPGFAQEIVRQFARWE